MEYMLIVYADETKAMPAGGELATLVEEYRHFTEGIAKSGHLRACMRLEPSASAATVRQQNGKPQATRGPATGGAREHLAGYYVVECADLDEAAAIAGRIPGVRRGETVEVRPIAPR